MRSRALAALAVAASVAAGHPAHAQSSSDLARSEALFNEAVKLMDAARFAEACPKLEASQKLVRGVGVTLYLGECYQRSGKTASAWAQFRLAEAIAGAKDDKRAQVAHDRAAGLEPSLPMMKIVVPGATSVPGLVVSEDGSDVDRGEWGVELPVDPGPHTFVARAPQKTDWTKTVSIPASHGTTLIEVPALADVAVSQVATPPVVSTVPVVETSPSVDTARKSGGTQRLVGFVLAGAGVVGLGVGTVFGLTAKSKFSDSDANGCNKTTDQCDPTGYALRSDGLSAATASTIAFGVGAAALVAGVVVVLTAPKDHPVVGLRPIAGPQEAGLTLYGAW